MLLQVIQIYLITSTRQPTQGLIMFLDNFNPQPGGLK